MGVRFAVAVIMGVMALASAPKGRAADDACIRQAPADAVKTLPVPLAKWGQLICTPMGFALTGGGDWIWVDPKDRSRVVIAADRGQDSGAPAYFTKIAATEVSGAEYDMVYSVIHRGLADEQKPKGYRIDLQSADGAEATLYAFDYFSYVWSIGCDHAMCDPSSFFIMLNRNVKPEDLKPPV
jgi:hypothetical protein